MPFDAPFHLGPFMVGDDGRLALASRERLPQFNLTWRGCRVDAQLRAAPSDDLQGELHLQAQVGRVPSTALCHGEPGPAARRVDVFAALRSLPSSLPEGWQVSLLADHRVVLLSAAKLTMPTTVTALLADVTMFLLALGPYLDLLDEVGVEGVMAGMVKT